MRIPLHSLCYLIRPLLICDLHSSTFNAHNSIERLTMDSKLDMHYLVRRSEVSYRLGGTRMILSANGFLPESGRSKKIELWAATTKLAGEECRERRRQASYSSCSLLGRIADTRTLWCWSANHRTACSAATRQAFARTGNSELGHSSPVVS